MIEDSTFLKYTRAVVVNDNDTATVRVNHASTKEAMLNVLRVLQTGMFHTKTGWGVTVPGHESEIAEYFLQDALRLMKIDPEDAKY